MDVCALRKLQVSVKGVVDRLIVRLDAAQGLLSPICSVGSERAVVDESNPKLAERACSNGTQVLEPALLAQSNRVKAKGVGSFCLNGSQAKL
jgi:predicted RNA methylase